MTHWNMPPEGESYAKSQRQEFQIVQEIGSQYHLYGSCKFS